MSLRRNVVSASVVFVDAAFEISLRRRVDISEYRNFEISTKNWRRRLFLDQLEFSVLDGDDGFCLGRQVAF